MSSTEFVLPLTSCRPAISGTPILHVGFLRFCNVCSWHDCIVNRRRGGEANRGTSGLLLDVVNDHRVFEIREIKAAAAQPLVKHRDFLKRPLPADFILELKNNKSAAFLVLKNGEVLTEEYFNG